MQWDEVEAFAQLDIVLIKEGNVNFFRKRRSGPIVDLTFVSPAVARRMSWHVSEDTFGVISKQLSSNYGGKVIRQHDKSQEGHQPDLQKHWTSKEW